MNRRTIASAVSLEGIGLTPAPGLQQTGEIRVLFHDGRIVASSGADPSLLGGLAASP